MEGVILALAIVAAVLLAFHVILHPIRTLGCIVEAVVGIVLLGAVLGLAADLLARH
jgi:hypothetical protein